METQQSQIASWISDLAESDFDITHRAGEKMSHVDALSRAPVEEPETDIERNEVFSIATR